MNGVINILEIWAVVRIKGRQNQRALKFVFRGNTTRAIEINAVNFHQTKARPMIRKLQSGEYRLYSRKLNPKTGKRRNLGTFKSRAAAEKHERDVQYFKRH
jgi:hypothetical protein